MVTPIGTLVYVINPAGMASLVGNVNSPDGGLTNRVGLLVIFAWYIISATVVMWRKDN